MPETMMTDIRPNDRASIAPPAPMCPCGCGNPMEFQENEKSWRCLACNPIPTNAPTCATQKCKRHLTWLEETGCWRCLVCNPIRETKPTEERERKYIDQKMTAETVQEMIKKEMSGIGDIVRETMAEFNLKETEDPDYPPTRAKINEIAEATGMGGENIHISVKVPKPETWLQKAKRLGVQTHNEGTGGMRKKVDIMADIEAKETKESATGG